MSESADDKAQVAGIRSVQSLQQTALAMLSEHIPRASTWTAIDYPMHFNVGDGAITLGQAKLAHHVGARQCTVLDRASYRRELVSRVSLPVIAGGGNWGGLYPTHHDLRLRVLADLRGQEVVQMPQSIHYASPKHREELRRAVGTHGRLTLLVRDQRSYDTAIADYDCDVHLVPDLVFTLGPLRPPRPTVEVVTQARTDREAQEGVRHDLPSFDWLEVPGRSVPRAALALARTTNRAQSHLPATVSARPNVWGASLLAQVNLRRGVSLLGRARYIVTDRLHGHVLSYLLGRPHVVVDDRYGKIRALHDSWLAGDPRSVLVPRWEDVPDALARLQRKFPEL